MDLVYFPMRDFGPVMKGMVIGGLGIFHVFLAQFAVGGGILMCYFQWLAQTGRSDAARDFVDGFFKALVLVSFVIGALTGVGMWFTSVQVSPRTIGTMVAEFHWIWATEWTFFCLEIVSGYAFYRYASRLNDRTRLSLLITYAVAAWGSLFWINGILSWQLTPGRWLETGVVWDGIFNPSFWPSLVYRTITCLVIAALAACLVINLMVHRDRDVRRELIHRAAYFLAPMLLMPVLGLWYFGNLPADSRRWAVGGSTTMTLFLLLSVGASVLIGAYAWFGLLRRRMYINAATSTLLLVLALAATAGGEFVREGVRKPFSIRGVLYSNSIAPTEVAELRRLGIAASDPYPLPQSADVPPEPFRLGSRVFRIQCSVCHTVAGANGLVHLTGTWTLEQKRMNIAMLQHTREFMPPFSGSAEELEALVQWLSWEAAGRPVGPIPPTDDAALARIANWLDEAGTEPGVATAIREAKRSP
jgi:cytochrome bd-type quinol oxidase subunit 1